MQDAVQLSDNSVSLQFVAIQFHDLAAHGIQNNLALFIMRSHITAINATWTACQMFVVSAAPITNPIQNDRHRLQSNGLMLCHSSIFSHLLM
tara:strand:- start:296 stop:571 length:276 start_codon:yes stop_codon:yes gene_type:complete